MAVDGTDVIVVADSDRLDQLLSNLFRNAIEHAGDHAHVRIEIDDPTDGTVTVAVADDGPGIPPTRRSDVLERGVSLDGGTGLGLAIVGDIADAHGWSLSVTASDSGGARFVIDGIEVADG